MRRHCSLLQSIAEISKKDRFEQKTVRSGTALGYFFCNFDFMVFRHQNMLEHRIVQIYFVLYLTES